MTGIEDVFWSAIWNTEVGILTFLILGVLSFGISMVVIAWITQD